MKLPIKFILLTFIFSLTEGGLNYPNFGLEELIVLSTSPDGHNVTFTTKLQYIHRSEWVTVEGRRVDMRCEIGLLTRNIVIQGE